MCITNFIIKNKLRVTIPESPTFMLKFESEMQQSATVPDLKTKPQSAQGLVTPMPMAQRKGSNCRFVSICLV